MAYWPSRPEEVKTGAEKLSGLHTAKETDRDKACFYEVEQVY
jgi:hypothetical protein